MKEEAPILYQNATMGERVADYASAHSSDLPAHITDYHAQICKEMPETSNFMISMSEAKTLRFIAKMIGAKRVLEVGVYVGLSCLMWSNAVGEDGIVTGLESSDVFAAKAEETFDHLGVKNVNIQHGDAVQVLGTLSPEVPYDIIFIDAKKSDYPKYLETILASSKKGTKNRLVREGGLIIGDNVLRCGFVADASDSNPWRKYDFGPQRREYWNSDDILELRKYNENVKKNDRLESWLCPLWDGVNMSRLLD